MQKLKILEVRIEFLHRELELLERLIMERIKSLSDTFAKSEEAQRDYNGRSQESRQHLSDADKLQLPRAEADAKFEAMRTTIEAKHQAALDKIEHNMAEIAILRESKAAWTETENLKKEMSLLKETRAAYVDRDARRSESNNSTRWLIALTVTIVLALITFIIRGR